MIPEFNSFWHWLSWAILLAIATRIRLFTVKSSNRLNSPEQYIHSMQKEKDDCHM